MKINYFFEGEERVTYEEALKHAIDGEAVFIVGSGFATGAKNNLSDEDERNLWVGSKLAEKLAELVEMDANVQLDIVSQEYIDLFGEKRLVEYLKEHYSVDEYEKYYGALAKIENLRVYTTNYDNLIEKVCSDNGNKIKGINLESDIRKVNKDKMVLHLNGYIEDLSGDVLPESFKLTHLSYNNTTFFEKPWYPYLIEELHSEKAIFVIGLSFSSDLDIRRILASKELNEKIFFIQREDCSEAERKFLSKYGRVLLCGVDQFCKDLSNVPLESKDKKKSNYFKSFERVKQKEAPVKATDKEVYELFFHGREPSEIYYKNAERRYECIVNRSKIPEVVNGLKNGKSYIIYSELGNGKSVFVNQIVDMCPELKFYSIRQRDNRKILREIKMLCSDEEKKVLICDPANLCLDILKQFSDFDLTNISFLFIARASMYDNYYSRFYDIIDKMQNVQFMNPINLDKLENDEIVELDKIISTYGFYGDQARRSDDARIQYLKSKCDSKFQNILLLIFESMHIIDKLVESINELQKNSELKRILILAFLSSILELNLKMDDYCMILGINDIERVVRRNQKHRDLLDIEREEIRIKSSIVAKEIMKTDAVSKQEVFGVLVISMQKLDKIYEGSEKYKNAMINLVSCAYLSFVFGYDMDSKQLIKYYEQVKELKFCKKNLFFWEQYAIACVNLKEFDRAGRYFKTAYSLAKDKGHMFSAYQIDNHYARYLLEYQLYIRKAKDSLKLFLEAHRLLNKNKEIERDRQNSRYYKYRVARAYKEYYDTFAAKYDDKERKIFTTCCREMYVSIMDYIKKIDNNDVRSDVRECQNNLKYVLECENEI